MIRRERDDRDGKMVLGKDAGGGAGLGPDDDELGFEIVNNTEGAAGPSAGPCSAVVTPEQAACENVNGFTQIDANCAAICSLPIAAEPGATKCATSAISWRW